MDHGKVNGVPPQAHATAAQAPRATQSATDRFSRAMGESPRSSAATTADTPTASGMVRGAPVESVTREAGQDNREQAYRRWQAPSGGSAMSGVMRDMLADSSQKTTRAHVEPTEIAISSSAWSQHTVATQARATAVPRGPGGAELTQMLERMCSALYVGDKSVGTQRVVMALDHVMPGAAAEIVREGVHLSIRLHARSEESYRSMSSQRDALIRALNSSGERRVEVTVVQGDEQGLGDGRG